jgi:hypothetical protein
MTTDSRIRLARTLYKAADLFEGDMTRYEGKWVAGSPAAKEIKQDTFGGAWGEAPVRDAHLSVLLRVHATAEHLRSLGVALEHSPTIIPAFTLARGVLDQACGPWYRLAPGVDLDIRVRRFMNSELNSCHELLTSLSELRDSSEAAAEVTRAAQDRINAISGAAEKLGWTVTVPRGMPAPYIRTEHEGGNVLKTTSLADDIVPGIGKLSWRLHSAVAHGEAYGLAMLLRTDGSGTGPVEQTEQQGASRYAVAPLAYMNLLRRLYIQFGWKRDKQQQLWDEIGATWAEASGVNPSVPESFQP